MQVFLPCLNRSRLGWAQEVAGLRAGLGAVRGLSGPAVQALLGERERGGVFASPEDVRRRVPLAPVPLAPGDLLGICPESPRI